MYIYDPETEPYSNKMSEPEPSSKFSDSANLILNGCTRPTVLQ